MLFAPAALHIPDGFLSTTVALVNWALAITLIVIAARKTRDQLGDRQIPMMGVLGAFIFAAQAINFPVAAGTSGHLLGGALAAILLGPWAASLVMTAVIAIQALLFQDGGILAMGSNILNMGVLTAFSGSLLYTLVRRPFGGHRRARLVAAIASGWASVEVGAVATAVQLALSGTTPLNLGLPAMAGVHALIGVGEGLITAGAVAFLGAVRPGVLQGGETAPGRKSASFVVVGLLAAMGLALLSPWGSSSPDGLETVAERLGFLERGVTAPFRILPDYMVPFAQKGALTVAVAVGLGALIAFGAAYLLARAAAHGKMAGD